MVVRPKSYFDLAKTFWYFISKPKDGFFCSSVSEAALASHTVLIWSGISSRASSRIERTDGWGADRISVYNSVTDSIRSAVAAIVRV